MKQRNKMSKYRGLFTFDTDNHKYIPIAQANGVIDTMGYESVHKPSKPLIKDEKIRKAVRAWAEAEDIKGEVIYYEGNGKFSSIHHASIGFDSFVDGHRFDGVRESDYYTIAELCGEEG